MTRAVTLTVSAPHRHQLARLSAEGWRDAGAQCDAAPARRCLDHWAAHGLPLVVTRQPPGGEGALALGLPAPPAWAADGLRQRIALSVPAASVAAFAEFPRAEAIAPLLPPADRAPWNGLCRVLASLGAEAHVYGSHGWQHLSGLPYLHVGSDVDLWVAVEGAAHADAVAAELQRAGPRLSRRLDGELHLPDGRAFAWREWQAWRAGRTRAILCRTLHGVALAWHAEAAVPA